MARDLIGCMRLFEDRLDWAFYRTGSASLDCLARGSVPRGDKGWSDHAGLAPVRVHLRRTAYLAVGAFGRDLILRLLQLPAQDRDEIAGMVQLQVDKISPFPAESAVTSHEILRSDLPESPVLVAVARQDAVEAMGVALAHARIHPDRVDPDLLCRARLLQDAGKVPAEGRVCALVIEGGTPELIVFQDGAPVLFRTLVGLPAPGEAGFAAEVAQELGFTLMSLDMERGAAVTTRIDTWCETPVAGLADALCGQCPCDVAEFELGAMGDVLDGMARRAFDARAGINLRPASWAQAEQRRAFRRRLLAMVAWMAGIWLALVLAGGGALYAQHLRLAGIRARIGALADADREVRLLRRRVRMIEQYTNRDRSPLEILREVSSILPDGIDLTALTYRKSEGVKLSAEAGDVNQVYEFKNRLDKSALFREATLKGPRTDPKRRKEVFEIDLVFDAEAAE